MKMFVIVKKEDLSFHGTYMALEKDDTSTNRSYLMAEPFCAHLEVPEDADLSIMSAVADEGGCLKLEVDPKKVEEKANAEKAALVQKAYDKMNKEVLDMMAVVFGTNKPESATAYKETWDFMSQHPADWADKGLKASFKVAGLQVGDALDTEEKVKDYADAKLVEIKDYGIWRMQRIEEFKQERDTIISGQ